MLQSPVDERLLMVPDSQDPPLLSVSTAGVTAVTLETNGGDIESQYKIPSTADPIRLQTPGTPVRDLVGPTA